MYRFFGNTPDTTALHKPLLQCAFVSGVPYFTALFSRPQTEFMILEGFRKTASLTLSSVGSNKEE